jgi:hypothetical protein
VLAVLVPWTLQQIKYWLGSSAGRQAGRQASAKVVVNAHFKRLWDPSLFSFDSTSRMLSDTLTTYYHLLFYPNIRHYPA